MCLPTDTFARLNPYKNHCTNSLELNFNLKIRNMKLAQNLTSQSSTMTLHLIYFTLIFLHYPMFCRVYTPQDMVVSELSFLGFNINQYFTIILCQLSYLGLQSPYAEDSILAIQLFNQYTEFLKAMASQIQISTFEINTAYSRVQDLTNRLQRTLQYCFKPYSCIIPMHTYSVSISCLCLHFYLIFHLAALDHLPHPVTQIDLLARGNFNV